MTKQEAIEYSRKTGDAITHRHFSNNEYIIVKGNKIVTEEGYSCWMNEFFSYRTDDSWENDWSFYSNMITVDMHTEREEIQATKEHRYSHHTSRQVKKAFGGIAKFNRK